MGVGLRLQNPQTTLCDSEGENMGFLKGLFGALGDSGKMIMLSARAYQSKYPGTDFRTALERSLIETRPRWDSSAIQMLSHYLDNSDTPEQMVRAAVEFERDIL